jgi:short-subunit dehydrogenase
VGFTYSLREELFGTGVSLSVICPGFVSEAGMFTTWEHDEIPRGSGTGTDPRKVAAAVIRAIEQDKPDVVVAGTLPQLSDVALALSPRLSAAVARRTGAYSLLRKEAKANASRRSGG